jgi:para-aminobenzoate synthetase component I
MSTLLKTVIPYQEPDCLFARLAAQPWAIWLDSGCGAMQGRYDIMVAEPSVTLLTGSDGYTVIETSTGKQTSFEDDPFALLREQLQQVTLASNNDVPFAGGAVGYFGYDLARLIEPLPTISHDDYAPPFMAVGIYDWALVCDRKEQLCWLVSNRIDDENDPRWQQLIVRFASESGTGVLPPFKATSSITSNMERSTYTTAFNKVQHYLEEGDCYQVNLAQRFSVEVEGSPWNGYLAMREIGGGPFSAYMNLPGLQVLSTSPERFLKLENGRVETKPIKGTRRRMTDAEKDRLLGEELLSSSKDRAENLMIVDLLRNDLGKSCRTGSVKVPKLFALESHATVHHLVSTVTGELDDGKDALDLLKGCFPGGSVTGAPKLRAMQIIEELEPHRRGVYCGAIGYIGFDGNMDCNIAIRTAVNQNSRLFYHAGGGIVRDSVCDEEYQESIDKASVFLSCFGESD